MTDDLSGMLSAGLTAGVGLAMIGEIGQLSENITEPHRKKKKNQYVHDNMLNDLFF
jgi:hypothetical protein